MRLPKTKLAQRLFATTFCILSLAFNPSFAEEPGSPRTPSPLDSFGLPYAPYSVDSETLGDYVNRTKPLQAFCAQKTPVDNSRIEPGEGVELTLTFSHRIDPSTLPPESTQWTLKTPSGNLTAQDFKNQGSVTYRTLPHTENGIDYPPNTLVFRLPDYELERVAPSEFGLYLGRAPITSQDIPVYDYQAAKAYQTWTVSPKDPAATSRVLGALYTQIDDETLGAARLVDGKLTRESMVLTWLTSPEPDFRPFRERVFQMEIPRLDQLELGRSYKLSTKQQSGQGTLRYQQRFYPKVRRPQTPSTERNTRDWQVSEGQFTIQSIQGRRIQMQISARFTSDETQVSPDIGGLESVDPVKFTTTLDLNFKNYGKK